MTTLVWKGCQVSKSNASQRVSKPYEGFPLTPHPTGRWCKKIRGKLHYFGKTAGDEQGTAALAIFNYEWTWLKDGRTPPVRDRGEGVTVRALCNAFLTSKLAKAETGELSQRSFADYHDTCELLCNHFGRDLRVDDIRPEDFRHLRLKMAKRWGKVRLQNEINRIRIVFRFGFNPKVEEEDRLLAKPVRYGVEFDRMTVPVMRKDRQARRKTDKKMFEPGEIFRILEALSGKPVRVKGRNKPVTIPADPALKAMVLLGANCAFGNTDCANLSKSDIDLGKGWVDYPRPKTGVDRRVPLWPETRAAVRAAIAARVKPRDAADEDLVFLTRAGRRWTRLQAKVKGDASGGDEDAPKAMVPIDALSQRFRKLLHTLNINGGRGLGFYTLRRVFETIGGRSKDQVAVDFIMGHCDATMAEIYREGGIDDDRLLAVVNTVRAWLFPSRSKKT